MDNKTWKFIDYERGGKNYNAMWEHSNGRVSARVHLDGNYGWSYEKSQLHKGPDAINAAEGLMSEIIDSNRWPP